MKIPPLTDKDIIRMLRAGGAERNRAWEYIYKNWRAAYSKRILKTGCPQAQDEADAALHLVAVEFEDRVTALDNPPVENLCAYLVQCVWHKWCKLKKTNPTETVDLSESPEPKDPEPNPEEIVISKERKMELDKYLDKLDRRCKDILALWAQKFKMKEIAQKLQLKDQEQARRRKYKCLKKLKKIIDGGESGPNK